jgi:putative ABC transport system ATP-binding protein
MSEAVIEARNVVKVLGHGAGQVEALSGVDLTLRRNELALLMGPSGSGKTTLLSVLGCMLTPTKGTIHIVGRSTAGLGPEDLARIRREHVGFVFQSYHLFPTLTAAENVQMALDLRGQRGKSAKDKARDVLALVGLSHKVSSYPSEMSGGEQQRVALARAIVADPSVILADEPTAALDGKNGQAIMSNLARIAKARGCGVLVVTHDTRLLPFADRIIYIEDGRIVREEQCREPAPLTPRSA